MIYLGIVLLTGALGALEVPGLLRQKDFRTLAVVAFVLLLGSGYALAIAAELPIPSIGEVMIWLAGPLARGE